MDRSSLFPFLEPKVSGPALAIARRLKTGLEFPLIEGDNRRP